MIRFVDRDMMMHFRGGGVGHKSTRTATDMFKWDWHRLDVDNRADDSDAMEVDEEPDGRLNEMQQDGHASGEFYQANEDGGASEDDLDSEEKLEEDSDEEENSDEEEDSDEEDGEQDELKQHILSYMLYKMCILLS